MIVYKFMIKEEIKFKNKQKKLFNNIKEYWKNVRNKINKYQYLKHFKI